MTKKKRGHPTAEEILARPWCYYCERDFDDLKILISHQKAKHFKCEKCGRRLNTAGGLSVHMTQVHKENLEAVENALPNRSGLNVEIFGMEGIPEEAVQQHSQRVLAQFHQAEADRRAATGNPAPGSGAAGPAKKPKIEDSGDLKARLAAFKAKKAAAAAGNSGDSTPLAATDSPAAQAADVPNSPAAFSTQYPPEASPPQASFQQPFVNASYALGQQHQLSPYTQSHSPFSAAATGFAPPQHQPPSGPPSYQPHPHLPPYMVGPGQAPFPHTHAPAISPTQNGTFAAPPGLSTPAGLPQRPSFGAPQASPMQQTHQSQYPATSTEPASYGGDPRTRPSGDGQATATEAEVDSLIANAVKQSATPHSNEAAGGEKTNDKKQKKDKDKPTKLMYEDNEVSPEEKLAKLSRYAFDPSDQEPETALGDAVVATVTGPVVGENDVLDTQG